MRKVKVSELKAGMTIAEDILDANTGINFPIVCQGVVLNRNLIERLRNRHSGWVYVELSDGSHGTADETIDVMRASKDFRFEGSVFIHCDVPENRKIEAGGHITVAGDVGRGSIITSLKGSIILHGTVKGSPENPARIVSNLGITAAKDIIGADIKTSGAVTASGHIADSSIAAHGDITVESSVVRSQLYSESKIKIGECGDEQRGHCLLVVKSHECIALFQDLLKTDDQILELQKELESLKEFVALIGRIGRGIEQVSQEKKAECAQRIKRYKEVEKEIDLAFSRKAELNNEIMRRITVRKIFITGLVHPNVRITIENCTYCFIKQEYGLAFYVKDDKISASRLSDM